jgi:hypothetical protein
VDEITALYGHRDALSTLGISLADLQLAFQQLADVQIAVEPRKLGQESRKIDSFTLVYLNLLLQDTKQTISLNQG